ncbi:MAG TPA: response regulator [Nitrospirales bacterium]|nr:response regulator [Nitrospirales bacterium]
MATILVMDDERIVCDLLRAVLTRHGHEVLIATSGRTGLELFKKQQPRFTLLDLRMPEMNGIEVLKQIRVLDPGAAVIVLTGAGSVDLENQARQMGVTDFLSKGLSLDVLVSAMERVLQQPVKPPASSTQSADAQKAPSHSQEAGSILVVDDEPPIRDLLRKYLSARGYRVRVASDGQQVLTLVNQESPDTIVLDVHMPDMNGVEVLKKLREKNYAGGVIILTSSQDEALLQEGLELGSVDILGKPVDLERLELTIQLGSILSTP